MDPESDRLPWGPLIVWRLSDGRRGHDSQSLGLTQALGRLTSCQTLDLPTLPWPQALACWVRGVFPPADQSPNPHLIVGAGHGTHASLLAARRARGGKVVVLMRPTLPTTWFDFCIIPEHDPAPAGAHILRSCGPLNTLTAGTQADPARGLILIGGPSRHFHWRFDALLPRIETLLETTDIRWTLCNSPRTPATDSERLAGLAGATFVPCHSVHADWLAKQLRAVGTVWVTADSMSMIFEALSAGSAVGILELPGHGMGRVTGVVSDLVARGLVTPFRSWRPGHRLVAHGPALREADRCAALLLQRMSAAST